MMDDSREGQGPSHTSIAPGESHVVARMNSCIYCGMRMTKSIIAISIIGLMALSASACGDDGGDDDLPFGNPDEVTEAESLFTTISGEEYDDAANQNGWAAFPGVTNPTTSGAPHGNGFAAIFANQTFLDSADQAKPDVGSVLVKHNLTADDITAIDSITIMVKKESGFDPDNLDWFWTKMDPQGNVQQNGDGVDLAGRIGVQGGGGCIGCHNSMASDDYIVTELPAGGLR